MSTTDVSLWRSVRKDEYPNGTIIEDKPVTGVLYPDFEPKLITGGKNKGKLRAPDVEVFDSEGTAFVRTGGGTSLFDKADVFGTKFWVCFNIPKGTEVPESLKLTGPHYNAAFQANHYQIEPRARIMKVEAFKGALDNFARNAVVRLIQMSK